MKMIKKKREKNVKNTLIVMFRKMCLMRQLRILDDMYWTKCNCRKLCFVILHKVFLRKLKFIGNYPNTNT